MILIGTTTPGQSGRGSHGNKENSNFKGLTPKLC